MAEPSPSCIPALPEWTTSLADTLSTNLLGSDFRRPTGVAPLPPELWLKIFAELDAIDLMTSVSRSCVAFYRLVQLHRHYLPRLPVALRAWVAEDAEGGSSSSSTTYAVEAREAVYRGEPRVKVLYITQSSAGIRAEAEDKEGNVEQITLPLLSKLMSWMNVRWLAVEVQKEGNEGDGRKRNDNTLVMIINWIFRYFDAAEISELRLSSSNVLIEWQLDEHSIKLLRQLPLEEVTVENMPSCALHSSLPVLPVRLSMRASLKCSLLARWQFYTMDECYLLRVLQSSRPVQHSLYCDGPHFISSLSSSALADFILEWRRLPRPQPIDSLAFNSFISLPDFRAILPSKGLAEIMREIPYCMFRTFHPSDRKFAMELKCYGNALNTQWMLKACAVDYFV